MYDVRCGDGASGMAGLESGSVKLVYGSPPYPGAKRNYGAWWMDEWTERMVPFVDGAVKALRKDGFLVINAKANREPGVRGKSCSQRSLIVEEFALMLRKEWGLHCVDIEIWAKSCHVPTGVRCACQDVYEQVLWFSMSPKWEIDLDALRVPYKPGTFKKYAQYVYKPLENGLGYVRKAKKIVPNEKGALPGNVVIGGVGGSKAGRKHQAVQPVYMPERYVKACTAEGDVVVDPWMGMATTGVAALRHGRRFIGFDVHEEYVEYSRKRLEEEERKWR